MMSRQGSLDTVRAPETWIAALVIANHDATDALAAMQAAGVRLLGRVDWASAPGRLETQGPLQLIDMDCIGASDAALAAALPQVDQFARDFDARVVATFAPEQVDLVAANLFGPHVELLCAPSLGDRAAAYALSLPQGRSDRLSDTSPEIEGARLRQLSKEIAKIAETLARLSRTENSGAAPRRVADRFVDGHAPLHVRDQHPVSARDVRSAIRARRLRDQYFNMALFEDPAWDILLDLFAAELERVQVSVSSLCIAAAVAPTTALRWITKLTEVGLLTRVPDPFDRRRTFMEISPAASEAMRDYLNGLKRAGLALE